MSYKDTAQLKSLVLAQKVEMGEGSESCAELVLYSVHVKGQVSQSLQFPLHQTSCECVHVPLLLQMA